MKNQRKNYLSKIPTFRVGIDGFNLSLEKGTGVATYARTLARALSELGLPVDALFGLDIPNKCDAIMREVHFFDKLATTNHTKTPPIFSKKWFQARKSDWASTSPIEIPITGRVDSRSFSGRLPIFDRIINSNNIFQKSARYFKRTGKFAVVNIPNPPKIMHWTYPLPIEVSGSTNIYTVHDLVPLKLPHTTLDDKNYYYHLLKNLENRAHGICTVSEASKRDILTFFPKMASRLYNTYEACDTDRLAFHRTDLSCLIEIKANFDLSQHSYFIFFGSLEPKKNIGRAINAFLSSNSKRKLVIIGAMRWKSDEELRYVQHGISVNRIIMVNYLPERTLFALLRHARALLFPSLSEGFGLPVLEAMHCGVPVLVSKEGALPEITGNAALQIDAYNEDEITNAINRLDCDDDLCESLVLKGYEQVKKFSMVFYKKRLIEMYNSVS